MRKMNLAYKAIMAVLVGVSLMLATLTDTGALYYKFVGVFSSAFPIVWSQVLDACKNFESERTPEVLSPASETPKVDSPQLNSEENTV